MTKSERKKMRLNEKKILRNLLRSLLKEANDPYGLRNQPKEELEKHMQYRGELTKDVYRYWSMVKELREMMKDSSYSEDVLEQKRQNIVDFLSEKKVDVSSMFVYYETSLMRMTHDLRKEIYDIINNDERAISTIRDLDDLQRFYNDLNEETKRYFSFKEVEKDWLKKREELEGKEEGDFASLLNNYNNEWKNSVQAVAAASSANVSNNSSLPPPSKLEDDPYNWDDEVEEESNKSLSDKIFSNFNQKDTESKKISAALASVLNYLKKNSSPFKKAMIGGFYPDKTTGNSCIVVKGGPNGTYAKVSAMFNSVKNDGKFEIRFFEWGVKIIKVDTKYVNGGKQILADYIIGQYSSSGFPDQADYVLTQGPEEIANWINDIFTAGASKNEDQLKEDPYNDRPATGEHAIREWTGPV